MKKLMRHSINNAIEIYNKAFTDRFGLYNPDLVAEYYRENGPATKLPSDIINTLARFGIAYPVLYHASSSKGLEESLIVQNFYLYQRFYSQMRTKWEVLANSGDEEIQREFRSLFSHFRSDQDFLRIIGYEESISEGGISYRPEDHLTCYQDVRKRIESLKIGGEYDKKFDPAFWDKVFTRFQYGANGLKLEGGRVYAVAAHNNIDAIRVMLGDNSQYRRQGRYESCTPIYSAGTMEGFTDRVHAPFLYGAYNKKSETLGVVYDQNSIDVVSGDTQAYGSFGREPNMIFKSDLVPAAKDSSKVGELRGGSLFLTNIANYDTAAKKMVTNFDEGSGSSSAIMLAASNVWRRSNITPYLDPRNMRRDQYERKLGFNNRHPDATNRGKARYNGQDRYSELLISHKGSMRNSIDGIFIDITGVKSGKIKSQNLKNILHLMASYPFLKFYIYNRENSQGNVMKSYSSLVAREVLGKLPYGKEFCKLKSLLKSLDASAQEEVNKKAIMIKQIKGAESSELLSQVELVEGPQGFKITDSEGLELFSPVATSKIESDVEEGYHISQTIFFENRYERMRERFEEGKLTYADPSLTEREIQQWICGFLMSSMMVISEDKDKHRARTVEIQNMNFDTKDITSLYNGMRHLVQSFDGIFSDPSLLDNLRDRLIEVYKVADDFIKTFERKSLIEIFKELFPDEYNPELSFSTKISDFVQRSGLQASDLQLLLESNSDLIDGFINEERFQEFERNMVANIIDIAADNDQQVAILLESWVSAVVRDSKMLFNYTMLHTAHNLASLDVKDVSVTLLEFFDQIAKNFPFIGERHGERFNREVRFLSLSERSSKDALCDFFAKKIGELEVSRFDSEVMSSFIVDLIEKVAEVERKDVLGEINVDLTEGVPVPQAREDAIAAVASSASKKSLQSRQMDSVIDRAIAEIAKILADSPITVFGEAVEINKTEGLLTSVDQNFSITKLSSGVYEVNIDQLSFQLQRVGPRSPLKISGHDPEYTKSLLKDYLVQREIEMEGVIASATASSRVAAKAVDDAIPLVTLAPPRPPKATSVSGGEINANPSFASSRYLLASEDMVAPPRPPKEFFAKFTGPRSTNPFIDDDLSSDSDSVPPPLPPKESRLSSPSSTGYTPERSTTLSSSDNSAIEPKLSGCKLTHKGSVPSSTSQDGGAQGKRRGEKKLPKLPTKTSSSPARQFLVSSASDQLSASKNEASDATRRVRVRKLPATPTASVTAPEGDSSSSVASSLSRLPSARPEVMGKRAVKKILPQAEPDIDI